MPELGPIIENVSGCFFLNTVYKNIPRWGIFSQIFHDPSG